MNFIPSLNATSPTSASNLIYDILAEFYHEAAGRPVLTGTVVPHQTFGDQLRFNPHFHAIVLEGGFDEEGAFFYIPFSELQSMVEVFPRGVIKLLVERALLNEDFARNLLSWKHSGFSIDNSVRILDDRYRRTGTIIAGQPPVSTWHELIGEPTIADAVMDRLAHTPYIFELKGGSRRSKHQPD